MKDKLWTGLRASLSYQARMTVEAIETAVLVLVWVWYSKPRRVDYRDVQAMTESDLLAQVLELAGTYKLLAFHSTDSRRDAGSVGYPDLCIVGKQAIFAELKTTIGTLSPAQVQWKYSLLAAGIRWYLWRPADLLDGTIEKIFKSLS